ncbi:MAG: hypothetical protein ACE5R6_10265 [Candidatus Heimdallarchaeota archaeon]
MAREHGSEESQGRSRGSSTGEARYPRRYKHLRFGLAKVEQVANLYAKVAGR